MPPSGARNPIDTLSAPLLRAVFSLLPADQRARCACVCRGWHQTLDDPALWLRLDLSETSGVTCDVTGAALLAAAARARGRLESLNVTYWWDVETPALLSVVQANAETLHELRTLELSAPFTDRNELALDSAATLLAAAPALRVVEATLRCTGTAVRRLFRREPPFQPLRLRRLALFWDEADDMSLLFPSVMAEIRDHASLKHLGLFLTDEVEPRMVDLALDAAASLCLESLDLTSCDLTPAAAPALVRLLRRTTMRELTGHNEGIGGVLVLDAAAAALLAPVLRTNCTLHNLNLVNIRLWVDVDAATLLLGALTGHASLRALNLSENDFKTEAAREAAGAALGALVAANAPALERLVLSDCNLRDAGVGPLVAALAANTHLSELYLHYNHLSASFATQQLLPALLANSSLRKLEAGDLHSDDSDPDFQNAQLLMRTAVEFVHAREAVRSAIEAAARGGA